MTADTSLEIRVQGELNFLWQTALSDEVVRKDLGIKYISHMYDHCYYWYLWLHIMDGVFRIEMESCVIDPEWDWVASLKLKYYPHPEEDLFGGLAIMEQMCRVSEVFDTKPASWQEGERCACHGGGCHDHGFDDLGDQTGVPSRQFSAQMPPDLFFAGRLELYHSSKGISKLMWQSQDRWQVVLTNDYVWTDSQGLPLTILRKGDVDRNFAGWRVTDLFGTMLARAWSGYHNYSQVKSSCQEVPGLLFYFDGHNLTPCGNPDIKKLTACVELEKRR